MDQELKASAQITDLLNTPGGEALKTLLMVHIDSAINRIMTESNNMELCRIAGEIRFARVLLSSMNSTLDTGRFIREEKAKALEDLNRRREDQHLVREHRRGPIARSDAIG